MKPLIDIGTNIVDDMLLRGKYRGKQKHEGDLIEIVQRAYACGVARIICTAGTLAEAKHTIAVCEQLEAHKDFPKGLRLHSTVGVHPTRCNVFEQAQGGADAYTASMLKLAQQHSGKRIVSIGECGLDYDRLRFCKKPVQLKHFARHLALANTTQLPLFLHDRNTSGDFYDIVKAQRGTFKHGVVHSFTGTAAELKALLALGLYIGINGCSLKTEASIDVMRQVPLNRLCLETDAPWCGISSTSAAAKYVATHFPSVKPEKHTPNDGKCVKRRCEPMHMVQVVEAVANARGIPVATVAQAAYDNTMLCFFPAEVKEQEAKQTTKHATTTTTKQTMASTTKPHQTTNAATAAANNAATTSNAATASSDAAAAATAAPGVVLFAAKPKQ
jgi:TatD DNase family protein